MTFKLPAPLSSVRTTDQKGKAKEDNDSPSASATDLPNTALIGHSSGSSTLNVSQSNSMPLHSIATDISPPSSSASPSASFSASLRDPAFNYDPAPSPSASLEHDYTPGSLNHGNSEAFNVMEGSVIPLDRPFPAPMTAP
jgi:hypothetical protein